MTENSFSYESVDSHRNAGARNAHHEGEDDDGPDLRLREEQGRQRDQCDVKNALQHRCPENSLAGG
jgi:hypothetical protein